jgi:hypothetical protein
MLVSASLVLKLILACVKLDPLATAIRVPGAEPSPIIETVGFEHAVVVKLSGVPSVPVPREFVALGLK